MIKLNTSIKHNVLIGIFISSWLFIFAFFIKPFDDGTISDSMWLFISSGFSVMAFLCYALISSIQKKIYQRIAKWNYGLEMVTLVFFQLLFLMSTFTYYKVILNGGYHFFDFFQIIILKLALIATPILVLARIYIVKLIPQQDDYIIIRGENKTDVLKIKRDDLIGISNAQNYVEIFFTEEKLLKTKIIRSTLKKVQDDFDFLVQIHRSHLINPTHFKSWKNQDTISLTQMELPVSKKYKEQLLSL